MQRRLTSDERAVEGLPIRVVIAVIVGAGAVGLLGPMLTDLEETNTTEITIELDPQQLSPDSTGEYENVTVTVVTEDGKPVTGAQLLVRDGSLPMEDSPLVLQTGADSNQVTLRLGVDSGGDATVSFRPTQRRGTVFIAVVPPASSDYSTEAEAKIILLR